MNTPEAMQTDTACDPCTESGEPAAAFLSDSTEKESPVAAAAAGPMVKLQSSDEIEFEVGLNVAEMSVTIKHMLDDIDADSDKSIPLPNVDGEVLKKVLDYCRYHLENPKAATPPEDGAKKGGNKQSSDKSDYICPWDKEFFAIPDDLLFRIILAANYLDIAQFFGAPVRR